MNKTFIKLRECLECNNYLLGLDDQRDEKSNGDDMANHSISSGFETLANSLTSNKYTKKKELKKEKKPSPEAKVLEGTIVTMKVANEIMRNCKNSFDIYCDKNGPELIILLPYYKELYARLKRNGVKIRLITEFTTDNLNYCKGIVDKLTTSVKHLSGIKGNFAIADETIFVEATSSIATFQESKLVPNLIYNNSKGITEQYQFLYKLLWEKAIPAEQKIKEIEEGLLPIVTRIVDNPEEIYLLILDIVTKSNNGLSNCSTIGGFQVIYKDKNLFQLYINLLSRYGQGKANGSVRWITHIENNDDQISLINEFLNIGIEIRHSNNLPPMSFALSDKQFQGTIEKMDKGEIFGNILYSTEPLYIKHFQFLFEDLWNSSIDVQERIKQIERGIAPEMTKIIEDPNESKIVLLQLLKNAKNEILIVYPSTKSVDLQKKIGVIGILSKKSQQGIKIRIVSPQNLNLDRLIVPPHFDSGSFISENIVIREILKQQDFKPTIIMVDRKHVLILELKNDTSTNFEEATGLTTYSTSSPTVLSYISIFDSFWEQTEMTIRLGLANEKLIQNDEMEKEFINTAAHELRTPTQAIMGYTELGEELLDDILKDIKKYGNEGLDRNIVQLHKHFDIISRNAYRLDQLINNLLDVARIESSRLNGLQIQREKLNLVSEINECIKTQLDQKLKTKNITIHFINQILDDKECWVYADSSRLNQILVNLIDNAIKFSPVNSVIDIILKDNDYDFSKENNGSERYKSKNSSFKSQVLIGISDMGKGISPYIMPKLFEKFVTNSDIGTGLGLFISRKIVEAHGGKIWAFNNKDGIGSTFVFSLPKSTLTILDDNSK